VGKLKSWALMRLCAGCVAANLLALLESNKLVPVTPSPNMPTNAHASSYEHPVTTWYHNVTLALDHDLICSTLGCHLDS
jgi:hypothetical protein